MYTQILSVLSNLIIFQESEALNILLVFPVPSKSHYILGDGYAKTLLKAGHQVTFLSPFPKKEKIENLTDISMEFMHEIMGLDGPLFSLPALLKPDVSKDSMDNDLRIKINAHIHKGILESDVMKNLLYDKTQNFDVVLVEWFFDNLLISLGTVFQCPVIIAPSTELHDQVFELVDSLSLPSTSLLIFSNSMLPHQSLWSRLKALWLWADIYRTRHYFIDNFEAAVYDKVIRPAAEARGVKDVPSYQEAMQNVSMVLYNSHPSLGIAQSYPPNVVPVGGYHIETPTPSLPEELQKILDDSKDGVIYFSMGSILKSEELPQHLKDGLLKLFSRLKQTVLWKFDGELSNLPSNVYIRAWMPQQSILAHPNVKIFITHGGILSAIEAIHFGVLLIGVPIFGDQFANMARAVAKGYAVSVNAGKLVEELGDAIDAVLEDERFTKKAKLLSSYYHDRPRLPGDEIVYWVEHAYRTQGAPHLKSITRDVPLYQKLYLDLLGIVVVVVTAFVLVVIKFICRIRRIVKKKIE